MFKKAHLRLFSIITCILVAVFGALLGSINLITEAVVQNQSQQVLKQIAEGVEYNDVTSTFTFTKPEDRDRREDVPPSKPDDEPGPSGGAVSGTATTKAGTTTETATTTTSASTAVTDSTRTPTQQNTEAQQPQTENSEDPPYAEPKTDSPTQPPTSPSPVQTTAVQPAVTTAPPATQPEVIQTTQPQPDFPPEPPHDDNYNDRDPWKHWDHNDYPHYPNPDPFRGWDKWYYNNGGSEDHPEIGSSEPDDETFTVEDEFGNETAAFSVADGSCGSIVQLANTTETTAGTEPNNENGAPARNGEPPIEPVPKSLGSIDFFIIMADDEGNYLATLNNEDITEETAQKYITAILDDGAQTGMVNHTFQFYRQPKSNGTLMVFTDKGAEMDTLAQMKRTTIIIGVVSVVVLSVAAFFLSKKSIEPIKMAFEQQKRFVSDASHELKTPLTVISANADVLAGEIGENKWLNYIKSQTDRMNVLVNDLLNLTRLENNTTDFICTDFDLSKAAENTALPFECQAFEMNRKFVVDIEEGITVNGSERHIKQMMAIFIDNALKYSNEGGTVKVTLCRHGDKKVFSVFNTGQGVREDEKEKIFERFYRSDESRNRATGGYGLGLAIAKSVIDKHKFKVHVENQEGSSICFVVTMP